MRKMGGPEALACRLPSCRSARRAGSLAVALVALGESFTDRVACFPLLQPAAKKIAEIRAADPQHAYLLGASRRQTFEILLPNNRNSGATFHIRSSSLIEGLSWETGFIPRAGRATHGAINLAQDGQIFSEYLIRLSIGKAAGLRGVQSIGCVLLCDSRRIVIRRG